MTSADKVRSRTNRPAPPADLPGGEGGRTGRGTPLEALAARLWAFALEAARWATTRLKAALRPPSAALPAFACDGTHLGHAWAGIRAYNTRTREEIIRGTCTRCGASWGTRPALPGGWTRPWRLGPRLEITLATAEPAPGYLRMGPTVGALDSGELVCVLPDGKITGCEWPAGHPPAKVAWYDPAERAFFDLLERRATQPRPCPCPACRRRTA